MRKIQSIILLILVLSPLAIIPDIMRAIDTNAFDADNSPIESESGLPDDAIPNLSDSMQMSSGIDPGTADPITIERQGYYSTGNITARTDTMENTNQNLLIDTANNWKGSRAEVQVSDLTTLYAVNGTFDDGIVGTNINPIASNPPSYYPFGWNATSNNTDAGQTQRAAYDAADFIVVENEGTKIGPSGKQYTHYAGTSIVWTQTIENKPQVDNFILSFDYFYLRGVLGTINFSGNCTLNAYVNGERVYNVSLPALPSRGIWYETGNIPITITGAPQSFEFMIGLVIDETLALNADEDYNGDSIAEGISNTVYITAYLDNVRFISDTSPSFESVDLQFHTDIGSSSVTGSLGIGSAEIINPSYWTSSTVPISVSANKTVTFTYVSRLLSHRFSNSSYTTSIANEGVSYAIDHGISAQISAYTYLGSLVGYEENTLFVYYPEDWGNQTILDPFLSDITSQCTFYSNYFSIPESALSTLGWYEINLESPNYAQNIDVQINDSGWITGSIFRPTNITRPVISIQTLNNIPPSVDNVNISWYVPNGTLWYDEYLSGGIDGIIQGTPKVLDASHAGPWQIEVFWSNGTEFAYDIASFDVYHSASLIATPDTIETDAGQVVTGIVRYSDLDTGAYITDDLTTISGNWSLTTIYFDSNPSKNWWEVSLNTADIGAGSFVINVDAIRPYYDPVSCEIYIVSTNVTRLSSPNAPWTSTQWGSEVSLTFNYEVYNSGTSSWGPILNNSDVSVSVNWTSGYWTVSEDSTPGIYLVNINTGAYPSGTYLLDFTFNKPNHESQELFLTLIVSPMASSLIIFGSSSDRVDIEESRIIKMAYLDEGGAPVQNANVAIDSISPSSGLSHTSIQEVSGEEGNYSLTVTPYSPTVFTIRFISTGDDVEPASTVFVLLVNDVVTNLEIYTAPTVEIGLSETYNTTLRFEIFNGTGIENADISMIYSGPADYLSWNYSETQSGNYTIQFAAGLPSTYVITIIASKQYHQQASHSFSLIVRNIPTDLLMSVDNSADMGLTDTFEMSILYEMYNGTGIEDATINVLHSGATLGIIPYVIENSLGNYSIQFTATLAGSYLVTISATKQFHQGIAESFLLVVREISTTFVSLNGTGALVGFGHDYHLFVNYQNGSGYGLSGANVSVIDADEGISYADAEMVTPGVYSILLTPLVSNSFSLVVQASLLNHQSKIVFFTLTVTAIPTTLVTLNLSTSIAVDQYCTVYLEFQDEDSTALENATLGILNPPSGIDYSLFEELGSGVYRVTLTPLLVGTYDIVFRAQKDGYQTDYAGFTLTATIIQTELRTASGISRDSVVYSNQYELLVFYERTDLNQNISLANIDLQSSPSTDLSWSVEDVSGGYLIAIDSSRTGRWTLTITANKTNYAISSIQFILDITPIPISVEYLSERSVTEGTEFEVSVRVTIQGTQTPISNASVFFRISTTGTGSFIALDESPTPGLYTGTFTIPLYLDTTDYTVEVRVDKDNYELLGGLVSFTLVKINNDILRWTPIISFSGILLVALFGSVIGLRVYNTRKRRKNLEALQVKKRFDDVSNILGIIVLHKQTGLPIYSKMIKGGFEEAMVSAFITAITHFRSEFQMDEKHWEFNVIPISDIISAVPTKSLIVAFITVRPPSKFQETSMAAFGRATGALFDDILADTRVGIVDDSQTEVLDTLFYDLLDGFLIERFRTTKGAEFPKAMTCLVNTAQQLENGEGFRLEDLAKGMATCGIEESHAYKLVMDAIDDDLIEMTKETNHESEIPTSPSEMREILGIEDVDSEEDDESSP